MLRIVLLSLAGAIILVGFGLPFIILGRTGLALGFVVIAIGSVFFWAIETRTNNFLDEDSGWNRLMKADGENILERDKPN